MNVGTCELHQYALTSIATHISDNPRQTFEKHSRGSRSKTHKLSNEELQVSNDLRYSASNQDSYTIKTFRGPHSCSPSPIANFLPQRLISLICNKNIDHSCHPSSFQHKIVRSSPWHERQSIQLLVLRSRYSHFLCRRDYCPVGRPRYSCPGCMCISFLAPGPLLQG